MLTTAYAKSLASTQINGEAKSKSNDPSNDNEVVVPSNTSYDTDPTEQPCRNDATSQDKRRYGHSEDRRTAIGEIA